MEIASLKTQLKDQESLNTDLQGQLDQTNKQLDRFSSLICEQTWQFAMKTAAGYRPLANYPGVDQRLVPYIFVTQWGTKLGPLDQSKPVSILLIDLDGTETLILDTTEDCIIANPEVFPFGR